MAARYLYDDDMRGSGTYVNQTAGQLLGLHKLVYRANTGVWNLADADLAATMPVIGITMGQIGAGLKGEILLEGFIGDATWTWTPGDDIYASTVAGELTNVAPVAPDVIQIVAVAMTSNMIYFNSDLGSGGGGGGGDCAVLEGATAYVGFNACKEPNTNYFLCDGVADDVQIQASITYVSGLGGGVIYVESGTYVFTTNLILADNVSIEGSGWNTVFQTPNGSHCIVANNVDYFSICNLKIEAIGATPANGIRLNGCTNGDINGCYFENLSWCVNVLNSDSIKIHDNTFRTTDTGDDGVHVVGGSYIQISDNDFNTGDDCIALVIDAASTKDITDVIIENNICQTPDASGLKILIEPTYNYDIKRVIISDLDIFDVGSYGIIIRSQGTGVIEEIFLDNFYIDASNGDTYGVYVEKCNIININNFQVLNTADDGVYVRNVDLCNISNGYVYNITSSGLVFGELAYPNNQITVSNCIVDTTGSNGIVFNYVTDGVLTNCISNNNTTQGIFVTNSTHIEINNCRAYNNSEYGLREAGTSDILITGNDFRGNVVGGFNLSGITTTAFHNKVDGANVVGADVIIPEFFAPVTDPDSTLGTHPVLILTDGITVNAYNQFMTPLEYQELVTAHAVIVAAAAGDLDRSVDTNWGKICTTEDYDAGTDQIAAGTIGVLANDMTCIDISDALDQVEAGDLVGIKFTRIGGDASDTIDDDVYYLGVRIRYV